LSETFHILRINERDKIKKYIGLNVKYLLFLSEFNKASIFFTDFGKIHKYQVSWNSAQWKPSFTMRTYRIDRQINGQTDMTKSLVDFREFANARNKLKVCLYPVAMQPVVTMDT